MTTTREIITFQFGHYSNFVGAHLWNIQESSFCYDPCQGETQPINHEVLFREGRNLRGEVTFTPRLIALDLKGSLRALPQEGTLYSLPNSSNSSNAVKWPGEIDVQTAPVENKNEFLLEMEKQEEELYSGSPDVKVEADNTANGLRSWLPKKFQLDHEINVWSDFLRTRLHPRSILLLDEYHHNNEAEQFDFFGCGTQVAQKENFTETLQNMIRNLAEETDYLQGFQILLDGYNGFAGVAVSALQHLEEEYGPKARICYPLFQPFYKNRPGQIRSDETYRLLTSLLCLERLATSASLFSLFSLGSQGLFQAEQESQFFPHLSYKPELPYHTSAILGVALQTLTLPFRLKNSPTHLRDFAQQMSYGNRKLVSSHISLPLPLHQGETLSSVFSTDQNSLGLNPLTPLSNTTNSLIQSIVASGIPEQAFGKPNVHGEPGKSSEEIIAKHFSRLHPSAALFMKCVDCACKTVDPFPHIFSQNIGGNGLIQSSPRTELIGVQSVPVLAAYRNSSACCQVLDDTISRAKKVNVRKFHRCLELDVETDDVKEAIHNFEAFTDNYKDMGFLTEG